MEDYSCKGCLTESCRNTEHIGYKTEEGIVKCPCSICLIKMVCRNECEPYIEFKVDANEFHKR